MTNINTDDGLKETFNPVASDSYLCSEASKENVSVTFADLFEFNRHGVADMDETSFLDSIDCDQVPTTSNSEERSVSFAPSCQVIHVKNIKDNQAYMHHEPVKMSSPRGFCDDEIDLIPGVKIRKNVQGSDDKVPTCSTNKNRAVSFAQSCPEVHLVVNHTEGYNNHEIWYSRYDYMLFEDAACRCSQLIQDCESHGTFDGDLGHILGLEKIILCETYLDKRDALRQTVLNEQAVQQLVKHIRWSQGYDSDDESDPEDISLVHLARTSERLSLWARERAAMSAVTLEHELNSCKAQEEESSDLS